MHRRISMRSASLLVVIGLGSMASQAVVQRAYAQDDTTTQNKNEAEQAYKLGDYDRTVNLSSTVLESNPEDHVALYLRGSARVEQGILARDPETIRTGVVDAREAIELGGGDNPLYYLPYLYGMTNLALLEDRREHAEISVTTAGQVLSLEGLKPDQEATILYQRGLAKNALEQPEDAVKDFEAAIELNPKLLAAYTAAASTLATSGRAPQAKAMYGKAVEQFPENPLVYNNRGDFLRQNNELQVAIADYTRALEIDPNYFYAATNRGFALLQQDDPSAAETDFTTSLKINPNQPMVYGLRGKARVAQGKFEEALADHRKAVEMVPKSPVAVTDLGFALFFSGQYEQAAQSFAKAYELNPDFRQLQPWRVAALHELGKKESAAGQFQESFQKPAEQRDWVDSLLAFQYGKINSEQLLHAVGDQEPLKAAQSAEAYYFIGRQQLQAGDLEAAQQSFQRTLQTEAKHLSAYRGAKFALERM